MKVYLVQNSYGSYDGSHTSIDKIFDSKQKAEDYISAVKSRIEQLKVLHNNMSDNGHDENDDIYDNAAILFNIDFPDSYYDAWDGNNFSINEIGVE